MGVGGGVPAARVDWAEAGGVAVEVGPGGVEGLPGDWSGVMEGGCVGSGSEVGEGEASPGDDGVAGSRPHAARARRRQEAAARR